jgi:DNA-binding NarL/FixJ family response regulator
MRAIYDAQIEPARGALGEAGISAARVAGRAMTLEQAVDEALAWLERAAPATPASPDPDPSETETAARPASTRIPLGSATVHRADEPPEPSSTRPSAPGIDVLTRRERDVAILIGRGLSNREIAEHLVITEGTAESYVHRVLTRLDFSRRAQVAAWAVEHRLHERQVGQ